MDTPTTPRQREQQEPVKGTEKQKSVRQEENGECDELRNR